MKMRIVVVGGGISGLAAAQRCLELAERQRLPIELTVLEAASRFGGAIATEITDGFVIEGGPDSFLSEKPWALELARKLGLEGRLVGTNEQFRRTYIAHRGRLHPLPEGFLLLAPTRLWPFALSPLFSWKGKLRMAAEVLLPRGPALADETLASFVARRFGREAVERVAQPMIGGIYLANAEKLSLRATMPRFLDMERQRRSVLLAMRAQARAARSSGSGARWSLFLSFDAGLQVLVDALVQALGPARLCPSTAVAEVNRTPTGWQVVTLAGETMHADAVIVAVPPARVARMLRNSVPALASELASIATIPSVTVSLAYPASASPQPLSGFGFVVPRTEGLLTWACTLCHQKYPGRAPEGTMLVRAFLGGEEQAAVLGWDDARLVSAVREEIEPLLRIRSEPLFVRVFRYPETMPLYALGHTERVDRIERILDAHAGLALAGNSYRGVGIPDCIHAGQRAAERICSQLLERQVAAEPRVVELF